MQHKEAWHLSSYIVSQELLTCRSLFNGQSRAHFFHFVKDILLIEIWWMLISRSIVCLPWVDILACVQVTGDTKGAVFGGLLSAPLKPTPKKKYQVVVC